VKADWIPNIFRRRAVYNDLADEIQLHIQERTEQLVREGMSAQDAAREARRAFGNRTLVEERSREVWQWPVLESTWSEVRFALRQMRRSPGFTITAMLTLALAIGANAVVFGILNRILIRPLDVPNAKSLYAFETEESQVGHQSYPDYLDFRARNRSFEDLAAFSITEAVLDPGANPSRIFAYETSGNYFDLLGLEPYLGRFFHSNDERGPNSAPYVVLTYSYWHSHFQDDRNMVGRVVLVNRHPFTVIGVAPPGFEGTLLSFLPIALCRL